MNITDSHCHLTHKQLADRADDLLSHARDAGVTRLVTIGCGTDDAERAVELTERFDNVWAAVGIHPHDASDWSVEQLRAIEQLTGRPRVVAMGEMGLDYHYDFSPREPQLACFEAQLRSADLLDLPVVIHCREAIDDALDLIARVRGDGVNIRGVFHCYTGSADEARRVLDAGFHISLAGMVTFKKSDELHEVAKLVPADRLLVETDSPYISPEPVRKVRPNEPAHVTHTLRFVADLRGVTPEELAEQTTANATALFGLE